LDKLNRQPTTISGYGITDAVNTTGNQTIAGNKTFSGTVIVNTPVNNTDAANKAYVDVLKEQIYEELLDAGLNGVVKDIDGNTYKTKKIGTQVWMAENLKVTHYRNGQPVPKVTDNAAWSNLTIGARCYYYNDSAAYADMYGGLYNWFTVVDSRNLCPTGWHLPSDSEWTILTNYLGGASVAGGKLKESDTTHWDIPNVGATNQSGFTALPGGARQEGGAFYPNGNHGYWWSSTEPSTGHIWNRNLSYNSSSVYSSYFGRKYGASVRCVRN